MIRLAIAQLLRNPLRYVGLLAAVVASVALTVAAAAVGLTVQSTVNSTFAAPYAGVEYVRTGQPPANLPPGAVFDRVTQAAMLEKGNLYTSVSVTGVTEGPLQWREVTAGRLPRGDAEVATTGPTPPIGADVTLRFGTTEVHATVVGRVAPGSAELVSGSAGLIADNAALATWSPTDRPTGETRSTVPIEGGETVGAHVSTMTDRYFSSRSKYFLLLTAFTVVVAIVAALTIYSAMSVIAGARVRELGLVRAIGASTPGVVASLGLETLVLGVLGSAVGVPLGIVVARHAAGLATDLGIRVPLTSVGLPTPWLVAIGVAGTLVTVVSALPAAVSSTRRSTLDSIAGVQSRGLMVVCGVAAVGFVMAAAAVRGRGGVLYAVAHGGFITLAVAALAALIIPAVLRVRVPSARLGLALGYASRQWARSAAIIGIVTVAVALVAAVHTGSTSLRNHFTDVASRQGAVDVTVTSLSGLVESDLVAQLRAAPGVAAVDVPPHVKEGFAIDPHTPVLRTPIAEGKVSLARGASLETQLPTVRTNNTMTLVDESVVDKREGRATTIFVRMEGDAVQDPSVADPVRDVVAGSPTPVTMWEGFGWRNDTVAMVERILTISRLMSLVALAVAAAGIIGTIVLSWRERARDRALINTLGLTPAGSAGVMALELVLLAVPAAVAGYAVGTWAGSFIAAVAIA